MERLVLGSWVYYMGVRNGEEEEKRDVLDPEVSVVPDTFDLLVPK